MTNNNRIRTFSFTHFVSINVPAPIGVAGFLAPPPSPPPPPPEINDIEIVSPVGYSTVLLIGKTGETPKDYRLNVRFYYVAPVSWSCETYVS